MRENFYLTRHEYNRYCRWAASQLESVRFHHEVTAVAHDVRLGLYVVSGRDARTGRPFECRRASSCSAWAPRRVCRRAAGTARPYLHSADYLRHKAELQRWRSITIVGSGQSAAEILCDLLQDIERHGYSLNWVTRSSRFFQMDNAKLAMELSRRTTPSTSSGCPRR